ncbi:hypothetical protein [Streptomyces chartreusis]|uniref:hypothetical protein n=1 Tax=Streptomyces chartreusis TaxID=1969 RepID=UPI003697FFDC
MDLTVVDEAHRTSGSMGKAWADVHNQAVVPSHRRLYLTVTPRIWEERLNREVAELPREMAASIDDEKVFGPVLYKHSLASAVSPPLPSFSMITRQCFPSLTVALKAMPRRAVMY